MCLVCLSGAISGGIDGSFGNLFEKTHLFISSGNVYFASN